MNNKNVVTLGTAMLICSIIFSTSSFAQKSKMKLSDAEIASVAVTANQIDIDAAKLAEKKTKNPEVSNFARTMIADHQSVIDKGVALVTKLHVTRKDNALSRKLKAGAAASNRSLKAKSGSHFDNAYTAHEVAYHKAVISTVENTPISDAQNAELKSLLQSVLPVLRTHLAHAEMVDKKLK